MFQNPQKSFTLIELLIVIAIIAIIAGAVLVAINPAKRIAEANDSQRWSEVRSLSTAVSTYIVDNKGQVPNCGGFDLPADGIYRWVGTTGGGASYFLDDNAATETDGSGNDNDLSTIKGATYNPSGKVNGSYDFTSNIGDDEYLQTNNDPQSLKISSKITLAAWVFPTANIWQARIVHKWISANWSYYALFVGNGSGCSFGNCLQFRATMSSGNGADAVGDITIPQDQWTHIVATFDDEKDTVILYINGDKIDDVDVNIFFCVDGFCDGVSHPNGEGIFTQNIAQTMPAPSPLEIGGHSQRMDARGFVGSIDEVYVFDRVLSDDEIKALYNNAENGNTGMFNGSQSCDLTADLVTTNGYLSSIPTDPNQGNDQNSGYLIKRDPAGSISIKAPHASDYAEEEIRVSR